jgi:PKD repeat protein
MELKQMVFLFNLGPFSKWTEGIFQDVILTNNSFITYHLALKYQVKSVEGNYNPNHFIRIKLARNLVNENNWGVSNFPQNILNREIHSQWISDFNEKEVCVDFKLNGNEPLYNQLWIHNDFPANPNEIVATQWTTIKNVSLKCTTEALTNIKTTSVGKTVEFEAENANNSSPFVEYNWNFGDGSTSTAANPTHTYTNYGTYNVCLKIKDSNGCCTELCKDIVLTPPPHSCLNKTSCISIGTPGGTVYLSALLAGPNPVIPSSPGTFPFTNTRVVKDLCFSVEGRLIADVGIIFFNDHWYMGPGASIEQNAWMLLASQSVFQGCEKMWKGFVVPEGQTYKAISLLNSTVKDAYRGVDISHNNGIYADNTDFIDNYTGVYAGKSGVTATIKNSFSSCLFENVNGLLGAYNGQPAWNSRAHKGIDIENLTLLNVNTQIAQRNSFKNIGYGIWGKRSNLEVSGAEFINTDGSVSAGIHLYPAGSITKIVDNNYFLNLISAIKVNGGLRPDIKIEYNNFESTRNYSLEHYAIKVYNTIFGSVKIQNKNKFDYIGSINIDISGSVSYLKIDDNDFKISGNMVDPIKIDGVKFPSWITNNRFTLNYPGYTRTMVTLNNCSLFSVENNTMYDGNTASTATGFKLTGTEKSLFKNNKIYFPGKGFSVLGSEAVSSNGFCCNTVTGYPNYPSFRYGNENGGTYFRQNTLGKLELPGNFGKQYDAGNIWTGAGNTAFLENGTSNRALYNQFKVNENVPGGLPAIITPTQISEEWFKRRGLHPTCAERPDCGLPPYIKEPKNPDPPVIVNPDCEEIIQVYIRLMRIRSGNPDGESQLAQYSLEAILSEWEKRYGYQYLRDCLGVVNININTNIKIWESIDSAMVSIYMTDTTNNNTMNETMEEMQSLIAQIATLPPEEIQNPGQQTITLYNDLAYSFDEYNQLTDAYNTRVKTKAQDLIPSIYALTEVFPFLTNRKKVWLANMKIVNGGINSLSGRDWEDIRTIAYMCPDTAGQAVFEAQSLMRLANEYIESDSDCGALIPRSEKLQKSDDVLVFPNPGSEIFTFDLGKNTNISSLRLITVDGREIAKINTEGQQIIRFDADDLQPGIYYFQCYAGTENVQTGKIIIIR